MWRGLIRDVFLSASSLDMLEQHYTVPHLPCDAWFQQVAARIFQTLFVFFFFDERFPNKGIGRGGVLPSSSHQVWGYLNNIVYRGEIADRTLC